VSRSSRLCFLVFALAATAACTTEVTDEESENADVAESAATAVVPLDVPFVVQNPELPRGCEVTSLTMLLRHAGVTADKMTLSHQVKKVPYTVNGLHGDPYEGFVGSMTTFAQQGYGVYHGPIKALAEQYLPGRVADLTGTSFDVVLDHVAKKRPVWIITNATFKPLTASSFQTWQTKTGPARITWHEHSVVVTGFDATTVSINDPLDARGKNKKLSRADFRVAWEQMGKQAITYLPAATGNEPALQKQTVASCTSKSIGPVPANKTPAQLAPFDLTASHAVGWSDVRPGDALNRNVAGSARHFAWFAGWSDAAHTAACVVQPGQAGTIASAQAYPASALRELTPIHLESSTSGYRSAPIGVDCSVHGDGKLYCTNTGGAAMHASTTASSPVVNHLRTTYSWFECWGSGEQHAGGNTTWYRTIGDDNSSRGWIPAVDLGTQSEFDANPTARGLKACAQP
jgi:uncharacterized protein YvpB